MSEHTLIANAVDRRLGNQEFEIEHELDGIWQLAANGMNESCP